MFFLRQRQRARVELLTSKWAEPVSKHRRNNFERFRSIHQTERGERCCFLPANTFEGSGGLFRNEERRRAALSVRDRSGCTAPGFVCAFFLFNFVKEADSYVAPPPYPGTTICAGDKAVVGHGVWDDEFIAATPRASEWGVRHGPCRPFLFFEGSIMRPNGWKSSVIVFGAMQFAFSWLCVWT
jgi:hypothetical protein